MRNKKILIAITLIFLVFIGIILLTRTQRVQKEVPSALKPQEVPELSIPGSLKGGLTINFEVTSRDFNFPRSLPLLQIQRHIVTKNEAKEIAQRLGFTGEPLEARDVTEGTKYFWTDQEKSLVITSNSGTVKHVLNRAEPPRVANKQLSQEELVRIAKNEVEKLGLEKERIEPFAIVPLKKNPTTGGFSPAPEKEAQLFQVNLRYSISDYQILTIIPDFPLVFVQILPDGTVYNSQITKFESITKSQKEYDLKNFDEIKNSINEAILVNILNGYINIPDLNKNDIKKISIDKISLYYLLDNISSKMIQPVYLLEGPTEIPGYSGLRAQLYFSALSKNNN